MVLKNPMFIEVRVRVNGKERWADFRKLFDYMIEEYSKVKYDGKKIDPNSKETTVTHVDLVDDVKNEEDSNDKEKKTNSKGSGKRTKSSDRDGGTSKKRNK